MSTSLGVQKGSTLMRALSDKNLTRSIGGSTMSDIKHTSSANPNSFFILKKKRRDEIIKLIEEKQKEVGIKDIVLALRSFGEDMGEKTIQRELVSMIKDGVLKKTGAKRWSRYFLN